VVVVVLLVWAVVSPIRRPARAERAATGSRRQAAALEGDDHVAGDAGDDAETARARALRRSNDHLRGAKASRPEPHAGVPDDAFERFLRAGRDDER
jgi:hypothetical protein